MSCCRFENNTYQNWSLLSWTLQGCPDQDLPLWGTAGPCGCLFACQQSHNQFKTDEWQEPGIVTSNVYYYSENRAWEELARANRMRNIHIHSTSSHSHFSFSLFRGFKDLYIPTPAVVPVVITGVQLHCSTITSFYTNCLSFPTMFNHEVCNVDKKKNPKVLFSNSQGLPSPSWWGYLRSNGKKEEKSHVLCRACLSWARSWDSVRAVRLYLCGACTPTAI